MNTTGYYVGLDVGGSSMKAGVVDDAGRQLAGVVLPTEAQRGQQFGLERMCETIRQAVAAAGLKSADLAAIGVATPGLLDLPAGIILEATNLPSWRNVSVRQHIRDVFGVPTAFQNDANAAALGEFWAGAGRGLHSLVLFTLGTGIGGGIIWDGRIIEGRHSHGAEVGHHKIEMSNPRLCGCGRTGCLEAYAGANAVVARTREALASSNATSILRGREQEELTARDVFAAAAQGDELADRIVEETAFYLAVGAMNLMHIINPDMIVFGGGMMAAGNEFLERIRRHVRVLAFPVPAERTRICAAELGGDAGLIGAAGCGRQLVQPR
jgi:glucokinase